MNLSDTFESIISSTVKIICNKKDNLSSSGTGFIFSFCLTDEGRYPCVITNKHVVENAQSVKLHFSAIDESTGKLEHYGIELTDIETNDFLIYHPNTDIDLAAIPISYLMNDFKSAGRRFRFHEINTHFFPKNLNLYSSVEDIYMIGYPNGLWDEVNNKPIVRKGITATDFRLSLNNKSEFLIDMACFPGSSGSPVFLVKDNSVNMSNGSVVLDPSRGHTAYFLGVLYSGPQHLASGEVVKVPVEDNFKHTPVISIPNNLGYVIHYSLLEEFESLILGQLSS